MRKRNQVVVVASVLSAGGILCSSSSLLAAGKAKKIEPVAQSSPTAPPDAVPTTQGPSSDGDASPPLSEVINDKLSGLALEAPARRAELLAQAQELVEWRELRGPARERSRLSKSCERGDASPYCALVEGTMVRSRRRDERLRRVRATGSQVRALAKALMRGSAEVLSQLASASDGLIAATVHRVPDQFTLKAMEATALAAKTCPRATLLTSLGQRAESELPEVPARARAEALYQRAFECGNELASIQAGYRLGLLEVWDQKYDDAEKVLSRISDNPDAIDYRSRAIYWRFYAAKESRHNERATAMRARLLREYPLSLHALLVGPGYTIGEQPMLLTKEPEVMFRSKAKPVLNGLLGAAEALERLDEPEFAGEMLAGQMDLFKGAEPQVQLYGAVLMMRAGDTIHKFQMTALLFRENPEYISRPTLEMLYPMRHFDILKSYSQMVNPWITLSLIRQESAFNERARSPAGAIGLMQLMPKTARRVASVSRSELYDPSVNIRVGVKFFSRLIDRFSGDVELSLAAYNAGPERVDEWKRRYPVQNRLLFMDLMPFRETREYVASIARNYFWYLKLYGESDFDRSFGSKPPKPSSSPSFCVFGLFNPAERAPSSGAPEPEVPDNSHPADAAARADGRASLLFVPPIPGDDDGELLAERSSEGLLDPGRAGG